MIAPLGRPTKPPKNRGFTLLEVMMVVAILGILAAIGGPNMMGVYRRMTLAAEGRRLFGAFLEAQGRAVKNGTRHQIFLDRTNNRWRLIEDADQDGTFEKVVLQHPTSQDAWPKHIAFGPQNGIGASFPVPYNAIAHDAWCTPCGASSSSGGITFDTDGRFVNATTDALVSGSVLLYNTVDSNPGQVHALVFFGATGNVRLFTMTP